MANPRVTQAIFNSVECLKKTGFTSTNPLSQVKRYASSSEVILCLKIITNVVTYKRIILLLMKMILT